MIIIVTTKDEYFGVLESDDGKEWTDELNDEFRIKVDLIKESLKLTGELPVGMSYGIKK